MRYPISQKPLHSALAALALLVLTITAISNFLPFRDPVLRLERERSKVLKGLKRVNVDYHRIKAMEVDALEAKARLLKDLDGYDSDLVLAQDNDREDLREDPLRRETKKGMKHRKCSGQGC